MFVGCEFLKIGHGGGVHIHRNYVGIWVGLSWCAVLVLGGVVVTCLLIAVLCVGEPCVVFFFGPGDFGACCCFPFVHGTRDFVSIQCFAVNSLTQAFPEAYNSSFGIECPASSKCQPFEGGNVRQGTVGTGNPYLSFKP